MTGFTVSAFLSRNRVSPKEAFEGLELCEGKLSCTVLRGLDGSNPVRLLGCCLPPARTRTSAHYRIRFLSRMNGGPSVLPARTLAHPPDTPSPAPRWVRCRWKR